MTEGTISVAGTRDKRLTLAAAAGLLLIFLALGWGFIRANSQTYDEAVYLSSGYSYLTTGDYRLNPEHPPLIKVLAALPIYISYRLPWGPDPVKWDMALQPGLTQYEIGLDFLYGSRVPANDLLTLARIPVLLLGCCMIALIGWWSYRLWGPRSALIAMTLAAFEPNLIAHSSLVTTDLGVTLFTFLAVYLLWEYLRTPNWQLLIGLGLATGCALLSKFSAIILVGVLGLLMLLAVIQSRSLALPAKKHTRDSRGVVPIKSPGSRLLAAIGPAGVIMLIVLVMIPIAYSFTGYTVWWKGLSTILWHQGIGHPAFFLGEYSSEGWWNYFLVAFLVKTPLGTLLLIGASLLGLRRGARLSWLDAAFLLLPVLMVFGVMARASTNIGLRYVLPVYPFLLVFASRVGTWQLRSPELTTACLGVSLALTVFSSLRIAPHQLAYFNEAVGGPKNGPTYLGDSNIDWGQDLKGLELFVGEQQVPMIYFSYFGTAPMNRAAFRFQRAPGYGSSEPWPTDQMPVGLPKQFLAISVVNLQGEYFFENRDLYRWLSARTPVARIGYSIYVYDIARDADAHLQLARAYMKEGPQRFALSEALQALAIDPDLKGASILLEQLRSRPPE